MLPEAAAFAGGSAAAAPFPPCLGAFVLLLGVTGNCIRLPLITLWHTRASLCHTVRVCPSCSTGVLAMSVLNGALGAAVRMTFSSLFSVTASPACCSSFHLSSRHA